MSWLVVILLDMSTIFIFGVHIKINTGAWTRNIIRLKYTFISVLMERNNLDFKTSVSNTLTYYYYYPQIMIKTDPCLFFPSGVALLCQSVGKLSLTHFDKQTSVMSSLDITSDL